MIHRSSISHLESGTRDCGYRNKECLYCYYILNNASLMGNRAFNSTVPLGNRKWGIEIKIIEYLRNFTLDKEGLNFERFSIVVTLKAFGVIVLVGPIPTVSPTLAQADSAEGITGVY
ncbi:hypothetical protein WA026_010618 [Henosepilachna vigintioctopunctata]|uniref:Uncharacterized protein n=1 Tax=Henosepilachna vigintioctopunctata TaxID=420089 RepID=A0AAW1VCQ4_9CUCU